jgi:hypothetical protein
MYLCPSGSVNREKEAKNRKTQRNKDGLQRDQGFGSEKTRPYDKNTWALCILWKINATKGPFNLLL